MIQKFTLPLVIYFLFISFLAAQSFNIQGKVVDAVTNEPLEATTIYAESLKDSTLITYTISEVNGNFQLEGETQLKKLNIFFSFNGYSTLSMVVAMKPVINLGSIQLEVQAEELKGVNVVGERVPIKIKKDTLEFNADSFKTRPDATVEDVLKKLPGVDVDSAGKITVNGKEVDQVLVNGQVFFSNDPKVTTKSLPKEVISKIQILDTKTKTEEFTGEAASGDTKTINLTIKEGKNNGYLGRLSAGYGTDDRFQANGLLNYFRDKERVSIIAGSNNINNSGFSFDEIYDMVGRNSQGGVSINNNGGFSIGNLSFGFGQGIITSSNLGASYANQKKDEYEVDVNYFFANSDSFSKERTSRENILPNGSFFTNSETDFNGLTNSHQGGANLEFDIDKTFQISIQPKISVNDIKSNSFRNTISIDKDGNILNSNNTITENKNVQRNFSNRLTAIKKLDTLGSYLRLAFTNRNNESNAKDILNSDREIFGVNANQEILDQETQLKNDEQNYRLNLRYRQAIGKQLHLDLGYEVVSTKENNNRSVFDFNSTDNSYSLFNTVLSSDFEFRNNASTPYLGIRHKTEKYRWGITAYYQNTNLENEDFLQNSNFSKDYRNVLLELFGNYTIGKNKRTSARYNTRFNAPSVNQLQPISDVSNPLNISIGNPNLKPSITHNAYFNYNDYNWKERTGLFIYLGLSFQEDQVSPSIVTDADFLRTTSYVNVDGNYNHYGGIGYSKGMKKDSTLTVKLNIRPYFNIQKNVGFTNGERLEAKRLSMSPRISVLFNYKELIEIEPEYSISLNSTTYNLEQFDDINFTSQNLQLKTTTYWPKNVIWGNDIGYSYNGDVGPGFDKDAIFWNMSLGLQMMKKNGTLKILAYDLLNQNINTRRSTGQDFIQDFQGTVLQRYFMMSFTFKFDQFGGAKSKEGMRFF